MRPKVAVIDYGAGNLRSISRALEAAGADIVIATTPQSIAEADGIVLPGVGHAGASMQRMQELGVVEALQSRVRQETPFLGVCLGMQLLFGPQEEGGGEGLGLLRGRVRSLPTTVKVPQIGWNMARLTANSPIGAAGTESDFYFVHSFIADDVDPADVAGVTVYGDVFPSIVIRGNIWGTQFHPEKSSAAGIALLRAWVDLVSQVAATTSRAVPA